MPGRWVVESLKGAVAVIIFATWLASEFHHLNIWRSLQSAVPFKLQVDEKPVIDAVASKPAAFMEGRVLPVRVLDAVRNLAIADGPESMVNVAVHGGNRDDWAATAVYLARAAIVRGATFSTVEVYTDNPWGDKDPEGAKSLAKAYYDPRTGQQSPSHKFDVFLANREATSAEVDFDELDSELVERDTDVSDPDKRLEKAYAEARKLVKQRYSLPEDWVPPAIGDIGISGTPIDGDRVRITNSTDAMTSIASVLACLQSNSGFALLRGCPYDASKYPPALSPLDRDRNQAPPPPSPVPFSEASMNAGDALKEATAQINRLTTYAAKTNDPSVTWVFVNYVEDIARLELPLSNCITENCNDLPQADIEAFYEVVHRFGSAMTKHGIPPL